MGIVLDRIDGFLDDDLEQQHQLLDLEHSSGLHSSGLHSSNVLSQFFFLATHVPNWIVYLLLSVELTVGLQAYRLYPLDLVEPTSCLSAYRWVHPQHVV